ncbi:mercuric ion transport protein [Rhizobium aethiopicum]|uniref:Mercuric ion transport protein n=1 Tax=Rhizobium aethiopicum TaxID=1138170 RepID=A0A7W6Q7Z3_9HYPH|nr:mercury transport protein [Rhizobium aethiopicum]MBB4190022.1 mercuric ion transport protein [Rhizobium aethiopicum]MBB4580239.1 mercuric ion transport protein [Rhizobium aethiopicum]
MTGSASFRAAAIGAVLAAICCVSPLVALNLPLAGLGVWLVGAAPVVLPLMIAGIGLVSWSRYHHWARSTAREATIRKEAVKS